MSYDRYEKFRKGARMGMVPFVKISKKSTDYYETYRKNETRLDMLSSEYYGNPDFAWLIMEANPQYGSVEYRIPDGSEIRIPFPLNETISDYIQALDENIKLNR